MTDRSRAPYGAESGSPAMHAMARARAMYDAGEWLRAEQICVSLLNAGREDFEALNLLSVLAVRTGRPRDAAVLLKRAIATRPDEAIAHHNYGNVLKSLERRAEALASYERAIELKPDLAKAHNNRGIVLRELERFEEALESYDSAIRCEPGYAEAHNNRGNVLRDLERSREAVASYDRALERAPDFAEAHNNRGVALRDLNRVEEALESYARALAVKPSYDEAHHNWLHAKMHLCDWTNFDSQVARLSAGLGRTRRAAPPSLVLALMDSPALQRGAAEHWVRERCPARVELPAGSRRTRDDKIRIGYYSADFYGHATAILAAELFERHDRRRFSLVAFSFGLNVADAMTGRIAAAFDRLIDVRDRSDREVAQLSRDLEVDIAVDLKGFTENARTGIFSYRAAPIQVGYLGYPATMAAPYIDYLLADAVLIPPGARKHYPEKIVYLPGSYQANDRMRVIADAEFSREDLGLPAAGFVFCCFNNAYKITPPTFDAWMRILQKVDGSVLWLLEDHAAASRNLRKEAEARGVNAERLVFARRVPLAEHLARHRAADLFLDTLPCNAHTTASDALWAGLPVLTCAGESFAGRVAASLLSAIDLSELITTTQRDYESLAVELATHPIRLSEIRARLSQSRLTAPLFDTEKFTRNLERAYASMYERHRAGLAPEDIYVAELEATGGGNAIGDGVDTSPS